MQSSQHATKLQDWESTGASFVKHAVSYIAFVGTLRPRYILYRYVELSGDASGMDVCWSLLFASPSKLVTAVLLPPSESDNPD